MKTPYEQARDVYRSEPCARAFEEDLEAHYINGFVFSRPDFFIMGRPIVKAADPVLIVDPWMRFPSAFADCWHVYLFAGNLARVWDILPWPLPWVAFERKNELRFYSQEAIRRLSSIQRM